LAPWILNPKPQTQAGTVLIASKINEFLLAATAAADVEFDATTHGWTKVPKGVVTSDHNQNGSMHPTSWEWVTTALLGQYHKISQPIVRAGLIPKQKKPVTSQQGTDPKRFTRTNLVSPVKIPRSSSLQGCGDQHSFVAPLSATPCVLVDAGSEGGRLLIRSMATEEITHVAGVELQAAWFRVSVQLFKHIRSYCIEHGFRMPAVTLFRSCMLADSPQTKYLYSIASIQWMNNEVFDKSAYFTSSTKMKGSARDAAEAPLKHVSCPGSAKESLSANAARVFDTTFQSTTCIAVHDPTYFVPAVNFTEVSKPFQVRSTWQRSQTTAKPAMVSVACHHQHIVISSGHGSGMTGRLLCASQQDMRKWNAFIREWSTSLPLAYAQIQTSGLVQAQADIQQQGRNKVAKLTSGWDSSQPAIVDEEEFGKQADTSILEQLFPAPKPFNIHLSLNHLACLQPLHVLPGAVIDAYRHLLETSFPLIHFPECFNMNDLTNWSRSRDTQSTISTRRRDSDRGVELFPYGKGTTTYKTQVVFCANPGYHWIAFKVDTVKRYIATMCSLQGKLRTEASDIKRLISARVSGSESFAHFSVTVPNQGNAVDCGPLASMFMLFLAQNDIVQDTKLVYSSAKTACSMRMRMFADLSQNELTRLCQ